MIDPNGYIYAKYLTRDEFGTTNGIREDAPQEAKEAYEEYKKNYKKYREDALKSDMDEEPGLLE